MSAPVMRLTRAVADVALMVTAPLMVPEPPRVDVVVSFTFVTVKALPDTVLPFTRTAPPLMVVAPV